MLQRIVSMTVRHGHETNIPKNKQTKRHSMLGQMLTSALSDDMCSGCHFKLRLLWWHSINTRWIRMGWELQDLAGNQKEKEGIEAGKKYKKTCQMDNRDQLTWQMEVTVVTGRTWTCGGNGGGIKYIADVLGMWWFFIFFSQTEGRNWNVTRSSCMIMCILHGTFISNKQIVMLEALLCHQAYFVEIRRQ